MSKAKSKKLSALPQSSAVALYHKPGVVGISYSVYDSTGWNCIIRQHTYLSTEQAESLLKSLSNAIRLSKIKEG